MKHNQSTSKAPELYELTDGKEVFQQAYFYPSEFETKQRDAQYATDGNCYWRKAYFVKFHQVNH